MRVTAIDALQRGLLNLRANSSLILIQVAQGVMVAIITIAGLVPLALALGVGFLRAFVSAGAGGWNPGRTEELDQLVERAVEQWPMLLAALVGAVAIWSVGFLVFCWVQAGVLGTLAVGERRAAAVERPAWADFRVYTWADFSRLANRRIWPLFWLVNLYVVVGMVLGCFLLLALTGAVLVIPGESLPLALVGLGCLAGVVFFAIWLVLYAWTQVGKAELVVGEAGVWQTFRRSLALLGARLGAVALLLLLFVVASVALAVVFFPISLVFDLALGDSLGRQLAADALVMVLQSAVGAAVAVAMASAFVSLVAGER